MTFIGNLPTNLGNISLKLSDTHFIGISNDFIYGIILEFHQVNNSILFFLLWNYILNRYVEFLLLRVTRYRNEL